MDEGEHIKEVYAHYGLAMYLSQVLEYGIVNSLVYANLISSRSRKTTSHDVWAEEVDAFMDRHFEGTLGRILHSLKAEVAIPDTLEELLSDALRERNRLAHGYFRDRANAFLSEDGRNQMIEELVSAQTLFSHADKALDDVIRPLRERYGFTDERLGKFFEEYRSQIDKNP